MTQLNSQKGITVLDETGEVLAGAIVSIQSQAWSDITDINGYISLDNKCSLGQKIDISYLSYIAQTIDCSSLEEENNEIALEPITARIEEILLIGRNQKYRANSLLPIDIINEEEIDFLQAQTPSDLLEKRGNVFVQKSQLGGGSPVVRGFEANKVLLVVDGVRLNNAIYRNGHLQSSITLDEQVMESVEVLFGPGSIIYGSDALGGVIHFRTKTPSLSEKQSSKFQLLGRLASANEEKTFHANYSFANNKISTLFSATISDFGDLRAGGNRPEEYPDFGKRFNYALGSEDPGGEILNEIQINEDPNVQIGSQYSQQDYLAKIKFQATESLSFVLNSQYSTSSNIPRYDRLIEEEGDGLAFAEWYYGPQTRKLISLTSMLSRSTKLFDDLFIIGSFQGIEEKRVSRSFNSNTREVNDENLNVSGLTIDLNKRLNNSISLSYGLDYQYNTLRSEASENIFTRYPNGNNSMSLYGAYLKTEIELSKQFSINTGVRYAESRIKLNYVRDNFFSWPEYFYSGIQAKTRNISYLSSIGYSKNKIHASILGGTAFRAPNIDDMAKIRVKADEITIPNPELKPERTANIELQLGYGDAEQFLSLNIFSVFLKDAIIRSDYELANGEKIFVSAGDSLNVTANINAERARILGLSILGSKKLNDKLSVEGSLNFTRGRSFDDNDTEQALGHIPPIYGKLSISHKGERIRQELSLLFNGKKPIDEYGGSVDNPELATPEGALAWHTFNYYINFDLNRHLVIRGGLENIFDKHYRPFASGISAAGRNFIFTLETKF